MRQAEGLAGNAAAAAIPQRVPWDGTLKPHSLALLGLSLAFRLCSSDGVSGGAIGRNEQFSVQWIQYVQSDKSLYVFGYMVTLPESDEPGAVLRPRILRIAEDGDTIEEVDDAFFGVEQYAQPEHAKDGSPKTYWFIDRERQRLIRLNSTVLKTQSELSRVVMRGPSSEVFNHPEQMPYYGFLVSIDKSEDKMWVESREGTGAPYAWTRDDRSGTGWLGDEGRIVVLGPNGTVLKEIKTGDSEFITSVFPAAVEDHVWAYFSRQGELRMIDRNGNAGATLPFPKFRGSRFGKAIDFKRQSIWYENRDATSTKLVKMSLEGTVVLSRRPAEVMDEKPANPWLSPWTHLSVEQESGMLWTEGRNTVMKLDGNGKLVFSRRLPQ
ncbi:MAG: hypothetical protein ACLQGV_14415 [Bryobacteraceae bacterium]